MRTIETRIVTPSMAAEWLRTTEKANVNRNIRPVTMRTYSDAMLGGHWDPRVCGHIIIGNNGIIIDGQHRLAAVLHSGVPIEFLIVTDDTLGSPLNLPIDQHTKRHASDVLRCKRQIAQIITAATAIANPNNRAPIHDVIAWNSVFRGVATKLMLGAQSTSRGISTVGVKLGFCVGMLEKPSAEDVLIKDYSALVTERSWEASSTSMRYLFKHLKNSPQLRGSQAQSAECYKTLLAIDNPELRRIALPRSNAEPPRVVIRQRLIALTA